jgi:cytidylate kinase
MGFVITVDGPSGAGKGTLCRLLAKATGFNLLDSGALYRLTALAAIRKAVPLSNPDALAQLASQLDIHFKPGPNGVAILLNGDTVTADIRQEQIGMAASQVAALPQVRAALLDRQRAFYDGQGLVADGRDMGTVVFPNAPVKIFLTASAEERAKRRILELQAAGQTADGRQILADIEARDKRDRERSASPLVPAKDALALDSTALSIEEVFQLALDRVRLHQSR